MFPQQDPHVLMAEEGVEVELRCEGRGFPPPTVRLYHDGLSLISDSSDRSEALRHLVVNQNTVGTYFCLASNTIVAPQGGEVAQLTTKIITVKMIG